MKKLAVGFALALTTVVAACSSSDTGSSGTSGTSGTSGSSGSSGGTSGTSGGTDSGTPASGNDIVVKSNQFIPATLTIKVGDTVTWTWEGGSHTVTSGANCTSDKEYGTAGIQSTVGATFTHTYTKAGTFEYFCEPHCVSSGMKGTIVVQ